jgi:Delta7-sterol 5-desaturase
MILAMDLGMYFFHRLAHFPMIYRLIHSFHHRHETTNPISLFVLHPAEVIGFGSLMITFLMIYPTSLGGLLGYLPSNNSADLRIASCPIGASG